MMSDDTRASSGLRSAPYLSLTFDGKPFCDYLEGLLLEAQVATRRFDAGAMVFAEGDHGDAAYFIRSGSVDIISRGHDGRERVLNHLGRGELFGEMAFLDQAQRSASAFAGDTAELMVIPYEEVTSLLHRIPQLALWMLRLLSHRLRVLTRTVLQMDQVQEVNRKILAGQEEERRRIARDIHDGVAQSFALYIMRTQIAERLLDQDLDQTQSELTELQNELLDGLERIRELMHNLYPKELDRIGLVGAITRFVERIAASNDLQYSLETHGLEEDLPAALQAALYCIVQEALSNVRRHAEASEVQLELRYENAQLTMLIADNGRGFDVGAVLAAETFQRGYGLLSMEERARLAGGAMELDSRPGAGTSLRFLIPVRTAPSSHTEAT